MAVAVCAGLRLVQSGFRDVTPPVPSAAQTFAAGPNEHTDAAADPLPPVRPLRLLIPGIDVDAPVTGLGLASDGSSRSPRPPSPIRRAGTRTGRRGRNVVAYGHLTGVRDARSS